MPVNIQTQPLHEIITLEKGKPPAKSNYDGLGAEYYLTPDYLRGKAEAELIKPVANAVRVLDGEAIVLWDGSNAGEIFRARNGILASTMMLVRQSTDYEEDYFYYALKSWEDYLKGQTSGSGIPHVDKEILGNLILFNCKKPEQSKIAEILSTVDRVIDQTNNLIAKQQRIKTGLMQDLLTRGIDMHGNLRSEETHKFKDSPLGRVPVEWDLVPISSVLVTPPKNGFSPIESNTWNGRYMLGLGCLTINGFKPVQLKFAPPSIANFQKSTLNPGDFLISRSNTPELVGLVGIYKDLGAPCIYPDLMVRLVFSKDVVTEYMEQVFMSSLMRRQIKIAATGTSGSMVKISGGLIKSFLFFRPPFEEQALILNILSEQDLNRIATEKTLNKLYAMKTALMQDLLTGKVRVTPLLED